MHVHNGRGPAAARETLSNLAGYTAYPWETPNAVSGCSSPSQWTNDRIQFENRQVGKVG